MKYIKLKTGVPFNIDNFEDRTNKNYPYYQNGKKYALCPSCGSSVQIVGGKNNPTQNRTRRIYAAHTRSEIDGLDFDEESKFNCVNYEGNDNNWQRIYEVRPDTPENQEIINFINEHIDDIAQEIESIIGFKCKYARTRSKLFEDLYQSFIDNGGLHISDDQFVPEYIPRMIVQRAKPVKCWGAIPLNETRNLIVQNQNFKNSIQEGQFKPLIDVEIVGVLDNDMNPTRLNIKLIFGEGEMNLHHVPVRIV
ncbi:Uncharacterised protein [Streptococcus dysgalactiae subsp. dysgalactiae]|uniref:Uncharacterized protein n=1 Tax=Streptococcus dysgalactiae subsp. dysgalactiae TaxID=99822 RepID=A0A380JYF1_STRDY|nr:MULTISPECIES: hypothetical protein [Streptococcus]SUN51560.1 Uncharacterised protein [Streptococcus dysgalactiae subsp. dysgalactiae]